jgi:hypothetical protein
VKEVFSVGRSFVGDRLFLISSTYALQLLARLLGGRDHVKGSGGS